MVARFRDAFQRLHEGDQPVISGAGRAVCVGETLRFADPVFACAYQHPVPVPRAVNEAELAVIAAAYEAAEAAEEVRRRELRKAVGLVDDKPTAQPRGNGPGARLNAREAADKQAYIDEVSLRAKGRPSSGHTAQPRGPGGRFARKEAR